LRRPRHIRHHRLGQSRDAARRRGFGDREGARSPIAACSEFLSSLDLRGNAARQAETRCDVLYQAAT
jgi:hypothetical protein